MVSRSIIPKHGYISESPILNRSFGSCLKREQLKHLKNYAFYVNSGPEQRLELLEAARPVEAGDGQTLLEAGYSCRDVVLVGRGRIRIYIAGENGREVTLYYVQPGESCPVNLSAAMMGIGAFADATDKINLPASAWLKWVAPIDGYAVTAGTGDLLKIENSDGAATATYDIVIVGTSA